MRKVLAVCLTVFIIINIASYAYCDGPLRKLGRGISNVLTCPLELPNRFMKGVGKKEGGGEPLLMYGFIEGIMMVGVRAAAGIYEVISFPFPVPDGYKPLLDDPEFLWKRPAESRIKR